MNQDLSRIVKNLGETCLRMYNPIEAGIRFPLAGDSLAFAQESIDGVIANLQKQNLSGVSRRFQGAAQGFRDMISTDKDLALAGRMFNHDLWSNWVGITMYVDPRHVNSLSAGKTHTPEYLNSLLYALANTQMLARTMAYLASHGEDKRYMFDIPISQIQPMLDAALGCQIKFANINLPEDAAITNDWGACTFELVKNGIRYEKGEIHPNTEICVMYKRSPSGILYKVIRVQDAGDGIVDEDGKPLSEEILPGIFSGYSTKGGGLGCQIIKALIACANKQLVNGGAHYVDVVSRTVGDDHIYFLEPQCVYVKGLDIDNLKLPQQYLTPYVPDIEHGAMFRLALPVQDTIGAGKNV